MTWPTESYQLYTGSYWGVDERFRRAKKKQPVGFAPAKKKKRRRG